MGRWGDRFSVKGGRRGCLRGCGSMRIFMLVVGFDYLGNGGNGWDADNEIGLGGLWSRVRL